MGISIGSILGSSQVILRRITEKGQILNLYTSTQAGMFMHLIAFLQDSVFSHDVQNQSWLNLRIPIYSLQI